MIIIQILFILIGLLLLLKGADWLVAGSAKLARKYNVSELAIGLTVVAFGTSAPELIVNIIASAENHSNLVIGNIIGSNNFNLFVILGIAGIIIPLKVSSTTVRKEIPFSFLAVFIFYMAGNHFFNQEKYLIISRIEGVFLLMLFCLFIYYVFSQLKNEEKLIAENLTDSSNFKILIKIVAGFAALITGGKLLVSNSVDLAESFGVSEKIIGLTIVAAGTSMPELATSVVAAINRKDDIAVGNIIGSNIFNIFFILAVSSIIRPVIYEPEFNVDLVILGAGTILLFLFMFSINTKKLDRIEAIILVAIYATYFWYLLK